MEMTEPPEEQRNQSLEHLLADLLTDLLTFYSALSSSAPAVAVPKTSATSVALSAVSDEGDEPVISEERLFSPPDVPSVRNGQNSAHLRPSFEKMLQVLRKNALQNRAALSEEIGSFRQAVQNSTRRILMRAGEEIPEQEGHESRGSRKSGGTAVHDSFAVEQGDFIFHPTTALAVSSENGCAHPDEELLNGFYRNCKALLDEAIRDHGSDPLEPSRAQQLGTLIEEFVKTMDCHLCSRPQTVEALKEQVEAADKQIRALRNFLDEQAQERELERDKFLAKVRRLEDALLQKDKEKSYESSSLQLELEQAEQQINYHSARVVVLQDRVHQLENNLHTTVGKIRDLRDIIRSLEDEVDTKTAAEGKLQQEVDRLQKELREQMRAHEDLETQLEAVLSQPVGSDLRLHISQLEEQLSSKTQQLDALRSLPGVVQEIHTKLMLLEARMDRKVRELQDLELDVSAATELSSPTTATMTDDAAVSVRDQHPFNSNVSLESSADELPCPGLEELRRLEDKLELLSTAQERAVRVARELEVQLRSSRKEQEELRAEKSILQEQLNEQLLLVSELKLQAESRRHLAAVRDERSEEEERLRASLRQCTEELKAEKSKVEELAYDVASLRECLKACEQRQDRGWQEGAGDAERSSEMLLQQLAYANEQNEMLKEEVHRLTDDGGDQALLRFALQEKNLEISSLLSRLDASSSWQQQQQKELIDATCSPVPEISEALLRETYEELRSGGSECALRTPSQLPLLLPSEVLEEEEEEPDSPLAETTEFPPGASPTVSPGKLVSPSDETWAMLRHLTFLKREDGPSCTDQRRFRDVYVETGPEFLETAGSWGSERDIEDTNAVVMELRALLQEKEATVQELLQQVSSHKAELQEMRQELEAQKSEVETSLLSRMDELQQLSEAADDGGDYLPSHLKDLLRKTHQDGIRVLTLSEMVFLERQLPLATGEITKLKEQIDAREMRSRVSALECLVQQERMVFRDTLDALDREQSHNRQLLAALNEGNVTAKVLKAECAFKEASLCQLQRSLDEEIGKGRILRLQLDEEKERSDSLREALRKQGEELSMQISELKDELVLVHEEKKCLDRHQVAKEALEINGSLLVELQTALNAANSRAEQLENAVLEERKQMSQYMDQHVCMLQELREHSERALEETRGVLCKKVCSEGKDSGSKFAPNQLFEENKSVQELKKEVHQLKAELAEEVAAGKQQQAHLKQAMEVVRFCQRTKPPEANSPVREKKTQVITKEGCPKSQEERICRHLQWKYLRAESFRKALIWQRKFFLIVLGGFRETEQLTLRNLAHLGVLDAALLNRCPSGALRRFRCAVKVAQAVHRMRFLVRRWRSGRRSGARVTYTLKDIVISVPPCEHISRSFPESFTTSAAC